MSARLDRGISYRPEVFTAPLGSKVGMVVEQLDALRRREKILVARDGQPVVKKTDLGFAEWVNFYVAPPGKGNLNPDALEKLRQALFPNIQTDNSSEVRREGDLAGGDALRIGYVMFDDKLGVKRVTTSETFVEAEEGSAERLKLPTEIKTTTADIKLTRRTAVYVVPHITVGEVLADMQDSHAGWVPEHFRNLEQRISSRQLGIISEYMRREERYRGEMGHALERAAGEDQIALLQASLPRI